MGESQTELNLKRLKRLELLGLSNGSDDVEGEMLANLIDRINKQLDVLADFVSSTKRPINKRIGANRAVTGLHSALTEITGYIVKARGLNQATGKIIEEVNETVRDCLGSEGRTSTPT